MKKLRSRLTLNRSGVVLGTVMITLLVMSIIIAGVVFVTTANLEHSSKTTDHLETYYVAEGGINYLQEVFLTQYAATPTITQTGFFTTLDNFAATYPVSNKYVLNFSDNNGKPSKALLWMTVETSLVTSVHVYRLHSEGYVGSISRTLTKDLEVSYTGGGVGFKDAVFATGSVSVGGAYVTGTISTNSTAEDAIIFTSGGYASGVYIPDGTVPTYIVDSKDYVASIPPLGTAGIYYQTPPLVKPVEPFTVPSTTNKLAGKVYGSGGTKYTLIDASGNFLIDTTTNITQLNTTYNLTDLNPSYDTFYVPNFTVTANAPNFILDIGNKDITIVTDKLTLNSTLKVQGTGKLKIYVRPYASLNQTNDRISISSTTIVGNTADSTRMTIYVADQTYVDKKGVTQPVQLTMGPGKYYFSLVASNLNFDLQGSELRGAVATNGLSVTILASSQPSAILIYAPNATVTMQSSSAAFYGAIVSKDFVSGAGSSHPAITYSADVNTYIPKDVIDLSGITAPAMTSVLKRPTLE